VRDEAERMREGIRYRVIHVKRARHGHGGAKKQPQLQNARKKTRGTGRENTCIGEKKKKTTAIRGSTRGRYAEVETKKKKHEGPNGKNTDM